MSNHIRPPGCETFFCANLVRTKRSKYVHIAPCGGPSNAFASLHYILFFVQSGPRVEDLAPLRLIAPHVLWRQKNVSDLNWISLSNSFCMLHKWNRNCHTGSFVRLFVESSFSHCGVHGIYRRYSHIFWLLFVSSDWVHFLFSFAGWNILTNAIPRSISFFAFVNLCFRYLPIVIPQSLSPKFVQSIRSILHPISW